MAFFGDLESKNLVPLQLDADFSDYSCVITTSKVVAGFLLNAIKEGFYAVKVDFTKCCLRNVKAAIVTGYGTVSTVDEQTILPLLGSQVLIDEDYDKQNVCLGLFNTNHRFCNESMRFNAVFLIGDFEPIVPIPSFVQHERDWFRAPVYSDHSELQGVLRSTTFANGLDLLMGTADFEIQPSGNKCFPMGPELASLTVLNGYFLLRSRFTRKGLSLVVKVGENGKLLFWLMNHSSVPVKVSRRFVQYVPLGPYNFERLDNLQIFTNWSTHGEGYEKRIKEKESKFLIKKTDLINGLIDGTIPNTQPEDI